MHLKRNPDSLITRIYGIFTIKSNQFREVDIIIMQHTAQFVNKENKMYEFDVKGSTFSRFRKPFNPILALKPKKLPVYKKGLVDLNFKLLNDTFRTSHKKHDRGVIDLPVFR